MEIKDVYVCVESQRIIRYTLFMIMCEGMLNAESTVWVRWSWLRNAHMQKKKNSSLVNMHVSSYCIECQSCADSGSPQQKNNINIKEITSESTNLSAISLDVICWAASDPSDAEFLPWCARWADSWSARARRQSHTEATCRPTAGRRRPLPGAKAR